MCGTKVNRKKRKSWLSIRNFIRESTSYQDICQSKDEHVLQISCQLTRPSSKTSKHWLWLSYTELASYGSSALITTKIYYLFFFLASPCSTWDLSSPTRDWTCVPTAVEARSPGPPGNSPKSIILALCLTYFQVPSALLREDRNTIRTFKWMERQTHLQDMYS